MIELLFSHKETQDSQQINYQLLFLLMSFSSTKRLINLNAVTSIEGIFAKFSKKKLDSEVKSLHLNETLGTFAKPERVPSFFMFVLT